MTTDDEAGFEYRGWRVSIETAPAGEFFAGHADLQYHGHHKCRVVLASPRTEYSSARWALDSLARDYIDTWTTRPHTGGTGFQEL
jgi:hypothetical protein